MKAKTRIAKSWYEKRDLPVPKREFWPTTFEELDEVLALDDALSFVGDGRSVSAAQITDADAIVRTEKMNTFVSFDKPSLNARVMCGLKWGRFKTEIRARGASVSRFRLYPNDATIGGILASSSTGERTAGLWSGALSMQCVGLNVAAKSGVYQYIGAPRKSSGPDLRALALGGVGGAIRDATIDVFSQQTGLVWFQSATFDEAAQICRDVWLAGWRVSWTHWENGEIQIAFHGTERVVQNIENWLARQLNGAIDHDPSLRRDAIEKRIKIPSTAIRRYDAIGKPATIIGSSLHGLRVVEEHEIVLPDWCHQLFSAVSEAR